MLSPNPNYRKVALLIIPRKCLIVKTNSFHFQVYTQLHSLNLQSPCLYCYRSYLIYGPSKIPAFNLSVLNPENLPESKAKHSSFLSRAFTNKNSFIMFAEIIINKFDSNNQCLSYSIIKLRILSVQKL